MPPRRTLLLLPVLLAAVGCRELLWQVERADETMHRNLGALHHRAAWLTVPRYQEPSGFSSTYREHLDRFDATHPNPAFVPQAGVGRTRPVHGIRGPVEPTSWSTSPEPVPVPPPAPTESRAPDPRSAPPPTATPIPTAARPARSLHTLPTAEAPRSAPIATVTPASESRLDDGAQREDVGPAPAEAPREGLLGRIRWSRLFARAEQPPQAEAVTDSEAARPAEPVRAEANAGPAEEASFAVETPFDEDHRIPGPAPAPGRLRTLLDRLLGARRPSASTNASNDVGAAFDDEGERDEDDLFDESDDGSPTERE